MMTLITLLWFKTLCLELNFSLIIKKTIIYAYMCYRQTLNVAKKFKHALITPTGIIICFENYKTVGHFYRGT